MKQGQWMTPHHEGDLLLWQVLVTVPEHFETEYSYCLVDEKLNVLKWEAGNRRVLTLPEGLPSDATVEIHDLWQVCSLFTAWRNANGSIYTLLRSVQSQSDLLQW